MCAFSAFYLDGVSGDLPMLLVDKVAGDWLPLERVRVCFIFSVLDRSCVDLERFERLSGERFGDLLDFRL